MAFKRIEMTPEETKSIILGNVRDLVADFSYYDRKEDEVLTEKILDNAIETGIVTIDEIVQEFRKELEETYKP